MLKKLLIGLIILLLFACNPETVKKQPSEELKPVTVENSWFTGYVIRDNTNIREESSIRSRIISTANDGDALPVLKNDDGWYEVLTADNEKGWIRSDLLGTADMSYAKRVADFADSTLKRFNTDLFIDENNPYAIIYMVLPDMYYQNKMHAKRYADQIAKLYQEKVYPGEVEIRILEKDKKTLFTRSIQPKQGATFLKAPYLRHGRPYSVQLNQSQLKIRVLIPKGLDDDELGKMAYEISANYGDQISKIEIYFVEETPEGIKFFSEKNYTPGDKSICRLYFLEDAQGPLFKKDFCNE